MHTTDAHAAPPAAAAKARSRRRGLSIVLRIGLLAGLAGLATLNFQTISAAVTSAAMQAVGASTGWLAAAAGLSIASMIAFGLLRQRTLRAAGARLPAREAVAISYAAGAIHLTTPGGAVLSTAYVFRRLQRQGLPPAAITWSLTISGVLSTVTLALLGVAGFAVGSTAGPFTGPAVGGAAALIIGALVVAVARRPDQVARLAERALRAGNRLLRRPADAGILSLRAAVADVRSIRPAPREWLRSTAAAAGNWLLDLLCLWACAQALGIHLPPWVLLTSYALAMAGASVSPLPGGVGIVDGILVVALTVGAGAPAGVAVGAVLLYRVLSLGTLLAGGWSAVGVHSLRWRRQAPAAVGCPLRTQRPR